MGNRMKHKRRNIVLIGFMGSGKTTLGLKLSYLLRMPVEDTDKMIERQEGRSISEIFADDGEAYFRELETEVLRKCGSRKYEYILSVGGGTPVNPVNRPLLHQCGTVVYLRVSPEVVYERLKNDTTRPLLQCEDPLGRIRELLEVRDKIYTECADIILDANKGHSDELAEELQLQLRKLKEAPKKKEREKKMKILVINGPNLNFLGIREKKIYGTQDYQYLLDLIDKKAKECFSVPGGYIKNDFPGALPLRPATSLDRNTLVSVWEVGDIMKEAEKNPGVLEHPQLKKLTEDDNPVLMVVYMK